MLIKNSNFTGFIEEFTNNTYIMVVTSDPKIRNIFCEMNFLKLWWIETAAIELNIDYARRYFQKNDQSDPDNIIKT